nr:PREDICTED: Z-DNA-binding protein 1 [Latimeria chalumnae]|eukprot:XP_005990666.1 PREDICTED: Z-DNA-binding protein 1 [Latimeria chalumnae]
MEDSAPEEAAASEDVKVLVYLKEAGRPLKPHNIAQKTGFTKQVVNQSLYRLQEQKKVKKETQSTWILCNTDSTEDNNSQKIASAKLKEEAQSHSKEGEVSSQMVPFTLPALTSEIFDILKSAPEPLAALAIAKKLGKTTRKEVNPILYDLQKKGCISNNNHLWSITGTEKERGELRNTLINKTEIYTQTVNVTNWRLQQYYKSARS